MFRTETIVQPVRKAEERRIGNDGRRAGAGEYGVVQRPASLPKALERVDQPAGRIQTDTSFLADLIENIQYDSATPREPARIQQTKLLPTASSSGAGAVIR
ncbi:hypothetical protein [Paraburkholderia sp. BCC1886]|uniref:hypothetical protein n=1 Tax=Paraburkholderia sp. BCC1886 TaxID=2562670 RepID=UPI0011840A12|nr:hypothetical protein [Paraburkholderia sp. BCC1886]